MAPESYEENQGKPLDARSREDVHGAQLSLLDVFIANAETVTSG
ncbi:hypothetical protein OG735_02500 [Streptomyces sp. NBC_01210]|nr:hypothetical protein OG735_02500 [Streptomyces sp. NBC_01210]